MRRFAALFAALDGTTRSGVKTEALAGYFRTAPEPDRVWTIALLSHRRPRRMASTTELRLWAGEVAGIPDWLFGECHAVAGDLAETIAHLLPPPALSSDRSLSDWIALLTGLVGAPAATRRAAVVDAWDRLPATERFVFNKLITGGFRMGVSQGLMTRGLALATGIDQAALAQRLTGNWDPATTAFADLIAGRGDEARPYPFALAHQLDLPPADLGAPSGWQAEWKWDGIRAQAIRRGGVLHLWSRGEELMTDRFPELAVLGRALPEGTVIDGELVAWDTAAGRPMPFASLQSRIGRRTVPKRLLSEAPARILAYDLLERAGCDLRDASLADRRRGLAELVAPLPPGTPLGLSPAVEFDDWEALAGLRATARDRGAEGLMLKRLDSAYTGGRRRGDWWKWKLDPYTIDAVMVYAQAGHGRRATLYTDFTFALREGNALVPVAKAYSGLTDAEFEEITRWVRRNTLERFGPVRRVPPELVFELGFEGVQESARHKSGVALRFPRMLRWRRDKRPDEIDDLQSLRALIPRPSG
ncbi:MAG: ATP-dependent DNA ligase [Gemmobacter sp.]